jgi:hypothetical protein
MKKILFVVLALCIGAFFVFSAYTNRVEKQEHKRIESAQTRSIQNAVLNMVQRNNAIDDWDTAFSEGDSVKIGRVMTIDLERQWLKDQPIMFSGVISDIKTYDVQNYIVVINRNLLNSVTLFTAGLSLELKADKKLIDAFILQWPKVKNDTAYENGVAVIAKIARVRTDIVSSQDGSTERTAIGEGVLIEIAYTSQVPF